MNDKIIRVEIVQGDIEHRLTLEEFRNLLVAEIGSVTWTLTRKQFESKVSNAVDKVIQSVRDSKRNAR